MHTVSLCKGLNFKVRNLLDREYKLWIVLIKKGIEDIGNLLYNIIRQYKKGEYARQ